MGNTILERYLCLPPMYVPPLNLWNINQFHWGVVEGTTVHEMLSLCRRGS
jgi:hypothetical protein